MRTSTLVTYPAQLSRIMRPVDVLSRRLHAIVSRRGVVCGAAGTLAAMSTRKVSDTATARASLATCDPRQLTPGEACACLCATDSRFR